MRARWKLAATAAGLLIIGVTAGTLAVHAQSGPAKPDPAGSSCLSVNEEDFRTVLARMRSAKPQVMERQMDLLRARYDLSDRPAAGVTLAAASPSRRASRSSSRGPDVGSPGAADARGEGEQSRDQGPAPGLPGAGVSKAGRGTRPPPAPVTPCSVGSIPPCDRHNVLAELDETSPSPLGPAHPPEVGGKPCEGPSRRIAGRPIPYRP